MFQAKVMKLIEAKIYNGMFQFIFLNQVFRATISSA